MAPMLSAHLSPAGQESQRFLKFDFGSIVAGMELSAGLCGVVQLVIGASPIVLAIALAAIYSGLTYVRRLGPNNVIAWIIFFYLLGNFLVALYAKTLLLQPLDSNLYSPLESFLLLALTLAVIVISADVAKRIPVGRTAFSIARDPRMLMRFSWFAFALGVAFSILNRFAQAAGGFGGFSLFRDLLQMAVIARTAALIEQGGRRSLDAPLLIMLATGTILGLLDDQKTAVALPVLAYFVTQLAYRGTLSVRAITALLAGAAAFFIVVAPVVHGLRVLGIQRMPLGQRVQLMRTALSNTVANPGQMMQFQALTALDFSGSYTNYFGTSGAGQMIVGRYASVQQIDPVVAAVDRRGEQGSDAILPAVTRMIPSILYPNKPLFPESFRTLTHYNIISPLGGKFMTLPLAGQAYAAYGIPGCIVITFIAFFPLFLAMRKWGSDISHNIYALFILNSFVVVYSSQGDFSQLFGMYIHDMPIFWAVFVLLDKLSRYQKKSPGGAGYA
jgi:hypothetical protein